MIAIAGTVKSQGICPKVSKPRGFVHNNINVVATISCNTSYDTHQKHKLELIYKKNYLKIIINWLRFVSVNTSNLIGNWV